MALLYTDLKADFLAARQDAETADADVAWDNFCDKLAKAVDAHIKRADVKYTPATIIAPSGGGPCTSPITLIAKLQ